MKRRSFGPAVLGLALLTPASASAEPKRFVASYQVSSAAAVDAVLRAGATVIADHESIGIIVAESDNPDFVATVEAETGFTSVVEDQMVQWLPGAEVSTEDMLSMLDPGLSASPGPPGGASFLGLQWNIFVTQTNSAWATTLGSSAVKVAVLDTGICSHHLDLAGKVDVAQSASFVPPGNECPDTQTPACIGCPAWEDRHFHGSHVAGIISTNNHGTAGVAPNVRLRAVKVLNCAGSGAFSWVISGIMHAADTGNDVINMSLGAEFPKSLPGGGQLVAALNKAVNYAHSKGVLVASAAGNSGLDLDHSSNLTAVPCESGSGLCVGSTTRSDALATFSNHGVSGPQITAPGGGDPVAPFPFITANRFILAPCSRHSVNFPACGSNPSVTRWLFVRGTSMASPHVAGAAAMADSVAPGGPGSRNAAQLRGALLKGADDLGKKGTDNTYSHGRLNVNKAVQ